MAPAPGNANRKLRPGELGRISAREFRQKEKLPIMVVLDDVRSMHNVGSVFRTADAFAVSGLHLCGITGTPPHREIEKTALGATQSVSWTYHPSATNALAQLKKEGYHIIAIEQTTGSIPLSAYRPTGNIKLALLFGNEVNGVSDEALALADETLEIPQFGTKHSFNIYVSAGIVLLDLYKK
jgi:tRNA G18 (ribose-2'-O)-methylase SpoU